MMEGEELLPSVPPNQERNLDIQLPKFLQMVIPVEVSRRAVQ